MWRINKCSDINALRLMAMAKRNKCKHFVIPLLWSLQRVSPLRSAKGFQLCGKLC